MVYESNRVICKLNLDNENITDNLALLKDLNGKLKALEDKFAEGNTTLSGRVNELLSRPIKYKSAIKRWIEKHKDNPDVGKWIIEAEIDLDGGSDGLKKQNSPGEVSQAVSNPNPVADTSQ